MRHRVCYLTACAPYTVYQHTWPSIRTHITHYYLRTQSNKSNQLNRINASRRATKCLHTFFCVCVVVADVFVVVASRMYILLGIVGGSGSAVRFKCNEYLRLIPRLLSMCGRRRNFLAFWPPRFLIPPHRMAQQKNRLCRLHAEPQSPTANTL